MYQAGFIKLKAIILLMVFSLNTVIGFACAVGIDMGFNSKHHGKEKKHQHGNDASEHHHTDGTIHHHEASVLGNHYINSEIQSEDKNNCCNDNVIKFEQLDKSIANAVTVNFSNPSLVAVIHVLHLNYLPSISKITNGKSIDRWCSLPPPDIRVSIQSFQI